eukprot:TRINITY_DN11869_c0_g1_i8.p1 TRINITY_DN11869_c0_g1~~TRINITY_DN11869_c0_g1_i8.p1  ORF type:complete len:140 (-),score=26.80 TRINITY_DN11869_c0_g1_i8:84-473(-)
MGGQYKLLNKVPSEGFNVQHLVQVNPQFSSPKRRIKLPLVAGQFSDSERNSSQAAVGEDRRHAIEACIVRVMKSRKVLEHQQLVLEVSQILMPIFRPDPRLIKNRIEDMIAREYIERDESATNVYRYLA